MEDFPANSNRAKVTDIPREKIAPVTSAEAVRRKRGLGRRFKDTFIGGDARTAMDYVVFSIVIPAVKDLFADAAVSGVEKLIYGDSSKPRYGNSPWASSPNSGHVAYNRMNTSQKPSMPQERNVSRRSRARHDFADLIIPSRQEAEEVIEQLYNLLSQFGMASVADLYELTGIKSEHTDMKWGWTSLRGAKAVRMRQGGFLLDLPEPGPLG